MKREAPGTMFHSMTVATLAEDAARAVGANSLKAKAAGLYHDIGKLEKAPYFIENNRRSDVLHRMLDPVQSAGIILGHVVEGLRLARAHRLSSFIRDAIRSHHGDTLVYFFYAKAKAENPGKVIDEAIFRYGGFPPREKELTILSLADACEAAVRSLDHPDPEAIRNKVEEIFQGRLRENQLRNSLLTLKELDRVKESFIATLISIHHGRIAYTAESINEAAAQQMEQPASSGTAPEKP
jgi:putative nucleotidyltransferase with HDIG domain